MKKISLILILAALAIGSGYAQSSGSGLGSILSKLGSLRSGSQSTDEETTDESQSTSSDGSSQSLLGSLLSSLIGNNTTVTVENITGTWNYSSPECRFSSENALAQAGGAVAASTVEEKLSTIYSNINIKPGNTSFTFNDDNTCVMVLGGKTINGTYTLDSETRELNIKSKTGLLKLNTTVYYSYSSIALLFDADKLLSIVKTLSAFTGKGSSTLSTVSSVLDNYSGMKIGMNLTKN